jgi:hypothetical protein
MGMEGKLADFVSLSISKVPMCLHATHKLVTFFPAKPASIQQVFKALLRWQNWQPRPILLFHTYLSYDLWKDHNSREISPFVRRDAYTPVGLNVLVLQSLLKQTKPSPPQPIFP